MQLTRLLPMIAVIYLGSLCLPVADSAVAQSPIANRYRTTATSTPSVSPYLNLAVDDNGLSNYSTLVRPMLSQRELRANQLAEEQLKARSQLAKGRTPAVGAQADARRERATGSFMNYSHYFGGGR